MQVVSFAKYAKNTKKRSAFTGFSEVKSLNTGFILAMIFNFALWNAIIGSVILIKAILTELFIRIL